MKHSLINAQERVRSYFYYNTVITFFRLLYIEEEISLNKIVVRMRPINSEQLEGFICRLIDLI
ncbi:hypothetical protein T4D_7176 [Trichinella pseudospiralis]|uniref:Uncharacterized protein n=1 Tax=Trichinella pseudospiralis TaxID=6337 RepID=A0A0V1FM78_TRIPS|nr:hypothetical protein T4D_7176 [Trichinella pseudospiralis]